MKIDCHIHCSHAERNEAGKLIPPLMLAWDTAYPENTKTPEEYVAECRKNGIDRIVSLDPVEVNNAAVKIFGDFVISVPMVDPDAITPDDIQTMVNEGAKGIKFISPQYSYGDNRYFPLYDVLDSLKKPAFFHCGYVINGFYEPGEILGRKDYIDITLMRPATLDRIVRAFPKLKIMMAHYGAPWFDEATQIIKSNKNIYVDLSGGSACMRDLDSWRQQLAPNGKLLTKVVEKICYGTDAQALVPNGFNGAIKVADFHLALYDKLELSDDLRQRIDYDNIVYFLGL